MKTKTLFDHVRQIVQKSYDPNYWNGLSDDDKKSFSSYMVHRYLSMNPEWVEIVNYVQKYSSVMPDDMVYAFYSYMIPNTKRYLKYITAKALIKYDAELISTIAIHFMISKTRAVEYIDQLHNTSGGKSELAEILEMYAFDNKTRKKILKAT